MAPQLPLVVCQSPKMHPARDAEGTWLAALLMHLGGDTSLIGDLETLAMDATDRLLLQGLQGSFVLAAWVPESDAWSQLHRLGIDGQRGRHRWSERSEANAADAKIDSAGRAIESASMRRIYVVDLQQVATPQMLIDEIDRLRRDQQTSVVSIAGLTPPPRLTPQPAPLAVSPPPAPLAVSPPRVETPIGGGDRQATRIDLAEGGDRDDQRLDALIDQLDALEL
jgi:hypothetical protein